MIEEKTNEITAIRNVIERLNLKGIICTWDALNTQKETVKAVVGSKGDYIGALKGNQGNFYQDVVDYFDEDKLPTIVMPYLESSFENSLANFLPFSLHVLDPIIAIEHEFSNSRFPSK